MSQSRNRDAFLFKVISAPEAEVSDRGFNLVIEMLFFSSGIKKRVSLDVVGVSIS